ncbi:MAG TPA: tetratricopeptide repeat protein [Vicinamibacterales bacterium]|nr:tetratricopeptide repeat protein [Vicinamibacterales bacterium]
MLLRATAASFVVLTLAATAPARAQSSANRILVMPFDNPAREPRLHWIAEAASLLVADELNARGVPAIRRFERVNAFEQLHLPAAATLSRATVIKVGQLVGASEVIVGTVKLQGEELTLEAHGVRIDVGRVQPPVTERGPLKDVVLLFERLSARLASGAPLRADRSARPPIEAFEPYVKGLMAESAATRATFLEEAIKAHPGYDRAYLALWAVRHDQADHAAALAAARAVPGESPLKRRAQFFAGVSLLELQQFDEAFDAFTASAEGAPPAFAAAALNNIGVVQLRRAAPSNKGLPTYFLTKAADADHDADILFNLGYAYVLERNYQGALYWLREALRRDPADAEAHYVLGAALQGEGSAAEAAREKELARQLSSRFPELEKRAVEEKLPVPKGMERLREDPEIRAEFHPEQTIVNTAQREQQDLASFHLERGRRLFDREEDRAALAELRRAVYLSPYEAQAHLLIGRIHLRAGRPAEAVDALKVSIWSRDTAAGRIALAEAYLRQQNTEAARTELQRALALEPESAEAKRLLATIAGK